MVGSVLVERMRAERDFEHFEPVFFSTSQAGSRGPEVGRGTPEVGDAHNVEKLKKLDVIVSCQGGDYTKRVHAELRGAGYRGYWIDAASTLRMAPEAVIVLDPVNRPVIDAAIRAGKRDYVGGNCTVSLMLMATVGLYRAGWVEWISSMTYQAASGAGAKNMRELVGQMRTLSSAASHLLDDPASAILDIDRNVTSTLRDGSLPTTEFGVPLAASLIPWIDLPMPDGDTREEWKAHAESNKILANDPPIPVDGICVRVGAMRCHSQGLTIKLTRDVTLDEIEAAIREGNDWVSIVPNSKDETLRRLSPAAVTGTLDVPIGRLHKLKLGREYLGAFTVGDQLLWGAAEPLRRMLRIVLEHEA
jgi:aspartate-semialdehyde dehydrogenase